MFKLSDITIYLIADIRQSIVKQLSCINIPDNIIDISDVIIFDNASVIINDLFLNGYTVIDTKEPFRDELLKKNKNAVGLTAALTDITEAPTDFEKIKQIIQGFNEEEIYNCRDSRLYPLITLTQLSRPGIKWTFRDDSWIEYGNYIARKIYYRNGSPKLSVFIDTIKNSEKLYIVRNNSFVEFVNPFVDENDIARVPYIDETWTWREIFFRATLIPAEFGKVKLVEKQPWKDAIQSILRDYSPRTTNKVSLNQYIRGVPYVDPSEH